MSESILNKIKNLLNKTVENGCTESEALAAMTLARKLMLKHKIEEKDVIDNNEKEIIKIELSEYNFSIPWICGLINTIAENYGVLIYIQSIGKIKHAVLFGLKVDVECVETLIKYAHDVAEQKASAYAREHRELFGTAKGIKYSWFYGFIAGLKAKYDEQNATKEYALMLTVDKDVENEFKDMTKDFEKKTVNSTMKVNDRMAMSAGYIEGKSFGTTAIAENN